MNSKLQKVGRLMVPNGIYKDQNGNEKKRWHEIGIMLASPHHSQIVLKLHASGFGDGQFVSVFYDEGKKPNFADAQPVTSATKAQPNDEIPVEEIPF